MTRSGKVSLVAARLEFSICDSVSILLVGLTAVTPFTSGLDIQHSNSIRAITALTFPYLDVIMACIRFSAGWSPETTETANAVIDLALRSLEASKDTITATAPVPGLSIALSLLVRILRTAQVCR